MKRASRANLKMMAIDLGIPWEWKTRRRLRREILEKMRGENRNPSLATLEMCRGVKHTANVEELGKLTLYITHRWWAIPFVRGNRKAMEEFGRNVLTAGVVFDVVCTVDGPRWRHVFIGVFVGLLFASLFV